MVIDWHILQVAAACVVTIPVAYVVWGVIYAAIMIESGEIMLNAEGD